MFRGNSLAVQWLGPGDFTAVASISGQGTKITQATQQSQKKKGGGGGGGAVQRGTFNSYIQQ